MDKQTQNSQTAPLQTPKPQSRNLAQIQSIQTAKSLPAIKKLIPLIFDQLQAVFRLKFTADNPEDRLILDQFRDLALIDLIRDFMAYIVLYDDREGFIPYAKLFDQIKADIKFLYRMMIGRLLGKIQEYVRILVMTAYFVFYFLLDLDFFDPSANQLSFLLFCLEAVHYEITGVGVQVEALKKILLHRFQNNYKVLLSKRSMMNIRSVASAFDSAVKIRLSVYMRKTAKGSIDAEQVKMNLDAKVDTIKTVYKNMVERFMRDKTQEAGGGESQRSQLSRMDRSKLNHQDREQENRPQSQRLKNSEGGEKRSNRDFKSTKEHYISELMRNHPRRG